MLADFCWQFEYGRLVLKGCGKIAGSEVQPVRCYASEEYANSSCASTLIRDRCVDWFGASILRLKCTICVGESDLWAPYSVIEDSRNPSRRFTSISLVTTT